MAKRTYKTPILMIEGITPETEAPIVFGNSVGTSGDEEMYSWGDDVTQEMKEYFVRHHFDDTVFAAMDTDFDLIITAEEFITFFGDDWNQQD